MTSNQKTHTSIIQRPRVRHDGVPTIDFDHGPFVAFIRREPLFLFEEEGEGGGGGGGGDERTYTQSEVERMIAARVGKMAKKLEGLDELKAQASRATELEEELSAIKAKLEDADADEGTKEMNQLRRELESAKKVATDYESKVAEAMSAKEQAEKGLQSYVLRSELGKALVTAGALPKAVDQATMLLMPHAELVTDGGKTKVRVDLDEYLYEDPVKAAEAWLKKNDHFARADNTGGGGANTPSSGGRLIPKDMESMSNAGLLTAGLATKQTKR